MMPLIDEEKMSYKKQKVCYTCKKGFSTNNDNKKSEVIVTTQKNIEELLIVFVI